MTGLQSDLGPKVSRAAGLHFSLKAGYRILCEGYPAMPANIVIRVRALRGGQSCMAEQLWEFDKVRKNTYTGVAPLSSPNLVQAFVSFPSLP